jgi:phosphoglycerol transferase
VIGAIVCYAAVSNFSSFAPSFIDSPELRGITASRTMMWLAAAASLVSLLLWIVRPQFAASLFLFVVLPICAVTESYYVARDIRHRLAPDAYDNAGIFARRFLSVAERDKLLVLGPDQAGQFRTLFYVDTRHSAWDVWSKFRDVPLRLGEYYRSALIIGDAPPIPDTFAVVRAPGFLLVRQITEIDIDFTQPLPLGIIARVEGLSAPNPGGTEATGDMVMLTFGAGLPEAFKLHLTGRVRDGKAPGRFTAQVGNDEREFELGAADETRVLEFRNPGRSPVVTVDGRNLVLKSLRIE